MISEKEIPAILEEELPEITIEIEENKGNIFRILNSFTNYTKKCAEIGNINKLKSCFSIADKLLKDGNSAVKSAVENVYVLSVSSFFDIVSRGQEQINTILPESFSSLFDIVSRGQEQINTILPESLKIAYLKHVTNMYTLADSKDENC